MSRKAKDQGSAPRGQLVAACRAVAERLEPRCLFSFTAALAGPPLPVYSGSTHNYNFDITTTGSQLPSSETFYAGDGGSQTFTSFGATSPTVTQWRHYYANPGTYNVTASVTPSGGSAQTIPLSLDSSFDASGPTIGTQVVDPPGSDSTKNNSGEAMTTDSSGDIFVASAFNATSTTSEFCVTKYLPTGAVDPNWGNQMPQDGKCLIQFDIGKDIPSCISLNGDCLMVGGNSSLYGWCVLALSPVSGVPNPQFNTVGYEENFHTTGKCTSILMEGDGPNNEKVLLGGYDTYNSKTQMTVIRLNAEGGVDQQWDSPESPGVLRIGSFPSTIASHALALTQEPQAMSSAQDILVGGWSSRTESCSTACDFAVAAIDTTGHVDKGFGPNSNGTVTANFMDRAKNGGVNGCCGCGTVSNDSDYSLMCWEDTSSSTWYIYAGGSTDFASTPTNQFALVRLSAAGSLDTSWQSGGMTAILSGVGAANSTAYSGTLEASSDTDPNATIVLAGAGAPGGGTTSDVIVARFLPNGNLDSTFGTSGAIATDFASAISGDSYNTGYDIGLGVGWDNTDGVIFVGGSSAASSTAIGNIAIAGYISNQLNVKSPPPGVAPMLAAEATLAGADQAPSGGDPAGYWVGLDAMGLWPHKRRLPRPHRSPLPTA